MRDKTRLNARVVTDFWSKFSTYLLVHNGSPVFFSLKTLRRPFRQQTATLVFIFSSNWCSTNFSCKALYSISGSEFFREIDARFLSYWIVPEIIIHNSTTNFTMTTLQDWNLENLYKCPGFFGELSEENAKDILREAFQNNGKTRCEGILFLKVRKFQNQIFLFSFPAKN